MNSGEKIFARHQVIRAAMTYPQTSRAVKTADDPIESCIYTCADRMPEFHECHTYARPLHFLAPTRQSSLSLCSLFRTSSLSPLLSSLGEEKKSDILPRDRAVALSFFACSNRIARESAKLRATNITKETSEIVEDISWYFNRYGACDVDGFDVRVPYGVALRMRRSPAAAIRGRTGVIDISAVRS